MQSNGRPTGADPAGGDLECDREAAALETTDQRERRQSRWGAGSKKDIWYYEQPLPEDRKNYTKTQPMRFEEFAGCLEWWQKREASERAWKIPISQVLKFDAQGNLVSANLDIKNPNRKQDLEHLPPEQLVDDILKKEQRIAEIMTQIRQVLAESTP